MADRSGDRREEIMREVCFCGRSGEVADREPVYVGDGEWGLECPACGRLDSLHWLPEGARRQTLREAARRGRERARAASSGELAAAPR
jgi:hypothetical protein